MHDAEDGFSPAHRTLAAALVAADQLLYECEIDTGRVGWLGAPEEFFGPSGAVPLRSLGGWLDRIHPEDRSLFESDIAARGSPAVPFRIRYRVQHGEGRWMWVEDRGRWISDGLLRRVGVLTDVSVRMNREEVRRDFFAVLAHELRNPLAAVLGTVRLMERSGLSEERMRWGAGIIERQGRQMKRLIDDILDVSRFNRGKVIIRPERFDLGALLSRIVEGMRGDFVSRSIALEVGVPPGPVVVRGDAVRLEQVIANLLANALRHTSRGGTVMVRARVVGGEVECVVEDTGEGIPAGILERIFEPFATGGAGRSSGGLGIGLAVARGIIDLHGGAITASSAGVGQGSTFTFRIPQWCDEVREDDSRLPPRAGGAGRNDHKGPGLHILIVEDDKDNAETTALLLRADGHMVAVVGSGAAALEYVFEHHPHVVLLDLALPELDGFAVAERIRRDDRLTDITIIALTGYGRVEDRLRTERAGFDAHLVKPIEFEELLALLHSCRPAPSAQLSSAQLSSAQRSRSPLTTSS